MNSLQQNAIYKENKKLDKEKNKRVEMLRKKQESIREKMILAMSKAEDAINAKYQKELARYTKNQMKQWEKNARKIKGKKELKKHKKAPKTLAKYKQELFTLIQKYVRLRDSDSNGMGECISCGRVVHYKKADGGHFISRKNMKTAFHEDNIHLQCKGCNQAMGGLFGMTKAKEVEANYRENLIEKIGFFNAGWLETSIHGVRKRHISEIQEKIEYYKEQNSILEANKN